MKWFVQDHPDSEQWGLNPQPSDSRASVLSAGPHFWAWGRKKWTLCWVYSEDSSLLILLFRTLLYIFDNWMFPAHLRVGCLATSHWPDSVRGWDGWMASLDGHEFEQAAGVGDGQGGLACCSPWGHEESDTTEQLNWLKDPWMLFCEAIVHLFWMFSSIPQNKYAPNYLLFRLLMLIDTGLVSVFLLL